MLTSSDQEKINQCFNVYEHNWKFYQHLLGEPFLLEDVLAYFDGTALFIPAFSLTTPAREFRATEVDTSIGACGAILNFEDVRIINVWGRFSDLPSSIMHQGRAFSLVEQSDYYADAFDTIFDVEQHLESPSGTARKRLRNLRSKGIATHFTEVDQLSARHRLAIERWMQRHTISPVHKEFISSLESYVREDGVWLCEASLDGVQLGCSVFGIVSDSRLVNLNSFPSHGPGIKAGDALFAASIEFAQTRGLRWIHRGYSATPELLWTKESWGAVSRGPSYREAFYVTPGDSDAASRVEEGRFLWRQRIDPHLAASGAAAATP